jgi:hypothetical protein
LRRVAFSVVVPLFWGGVGGDQFLGVIKFCRIELTEKRIVNNNNNHNTATTNKKFCPAT